MNSFFRNTVNLEEALKITKKKGYAFVQESINQTFLEALTRECGEMDLELGDHVTYPIRAGKPSEVRQLHERNYLWIGDPKVPVANQVIGKVTEEIGFLIETFPELRGWTQNEIGYQRYKEGKGFISPHRDRTKDKLLSLTLTLKGSCIIKIYEHLEDPGDYNRLKQIDSFRTYAGTVFFLRAQGLGNGEQVIHEVLPPEKGDRDILNLRFRPIKLKSPREFEETRRKKS